MDPVLYWHHHRPDDDKRRKERELNRYTIGFISQSDLEWLAREELDAEDAILLSADEVVLPGDAHQALKLSIGRTLCTLFDINPSYQNMRGSYSSELPIKFNRSTSDDGMRFIFDPELDPQTRLDALQKAHEAIRTFFDSTGLNNVSLKPIDGNAPCFQGS